MKTKTKMFTMFMAMMIAIVVTSCSPSPDGHAQADEPDSTQAAPFDINKALDNSAYKNSMRIVFDSLRDKIEPESSNNYESFTESKTIDAVNDFVGTLEKVAVYSVEKAKKGTSSSNVVKHLSVCILHSKGGHYVVDVEKVKDSITMVTILKIAPGRPSNRSDMVSMGLDTYVAMDGKGNGFINPISGHDQAMWPAPTASSDQFSHQSEEQHIFANARYLQLITYLGRIVEASDNHRTEHL